MNTIYLIRHGQTEYNRKGVLQGRAIDAPLNLTGIRQASSFFDAYKHIDFDQVITSDLQRSIQSVEPFIKNGVEHKIDPRITEFSWGENEGLPLNEIVIGNYRKMINSWNDGKLDVRIKGGESGRELQTRVKDFLDHIRALDVPNLLICTHGRTLKMMVVEMLRKNMAAMEEVRHSNMALYLFQKEMDKFSLLKNNDVEHLPESLQENAFWDK